MKWDEMALGGLAMGLIGFLVGAIVMAENGKGDFELGSMLGAWISGLGAFTAAGVALHLASRDDTERVRLYANAINSFNEHTGRLEFGIEFHAECLGKRPVSVQELRLGGKHIATFTSDYERGPILLRQGQVTTATISASQLIRVVDTFKARDPEFLETKFSAILLRKEPSISLPHSVRSILINLKLRDETFKK